MRRILRTPARSVERRTLNLAAPLSLLLLVAVCALWVRSYWVLDDVEWWTGPAGDPVRRGDFMSSGGCLTYWRTIEQPGPRWWTLTRTTYRRRPSLETLWPFEHAVNAARRSTTVPYWALALPLALAPAVGLVRGLRLRRLQRRRGGGLCSNCGYDLRATPEQGGALLDRCPECGAEGTVRKRA